jgi:hypothetical protein
VYFEYYRVFLTCPSVFSVAIIDLCFILLAETIVCDLPSYDAGGTGYEYREIAKEVKKNRGSNWKDSKAISTVTSTIVFFGQCHPRRSKATTGG